MQICLEDHYRLERAYNGQEGIDKAIEGLPDLIISDVMMPGKDGFELTKTLKNNFRTSHIPIVLLTAKANVTSRIEGLEQGADAYLAKPFNPEELKVRLRKLIELRQALQQKYSKQDFAQPLFLNAEKCLSLFEIFVSKAQKNYCERPNIPFQKLRIW